MTQTIDAAAFQQMVIHAAASINAEKQQINDLNVFPVPDGDTGTNMSLTIGAAAVEMCIRDRLYRADEGGDHLLLPADHLGQDCHAVLDLHAEGVLYQALGTLARHEQVLSLIHI